MDKIKCHISQQYNVELESILDKVFTVGSLVEEQVANAVHAVVSGDMDLSESVISHDYHVNLLAASADTSAIQLLARQHPTAGDLRLIVAVIKSIADLEHIGGQAVNIARTVTHSSEMKWPKSLYSELQKLCNHVLTILHTTLHIFLTMDATAAASLLKRDLMIDSDYETIIQQMMVLLMKNPRYVSQTLDIIWSARALERIEDHSRNVCENVIYFVEGKDVRHTIFKDVPKHHHENCVD
jgi:phosphate transport system protein